MSRIVSAPTRGFRLWYTQVAGIAAWMVHISALAALSETSCARPATEWVAHALTLVLGTVAAAGVWWSAALLRESGPDDEDRDPASRRRFLGALGLWSSGLSLLLIAWEGAYVALVSPCR